MSIPAILRVMSSFRPGSGRTRDSSNTHRYALIPLFERETSQRLVQHTRPGSNSVAASTSPERLRPLPSPAMTIVLHSNPFSSPLVARRAMGTPLPSRLGQQLAEPRPEEAVIRRFHTDSSASGFSTMGPEILTGSHH